MWANKCAPVTRRHSSPLGAGRPLGRALQAPPSLSAAVAILRHRTRIGERHTAFTLAYQDRQGHIQTYETNTRSLDTGSLLRLHFTHSTFRLHCLGRGMVAARVLRVPAHVLLLRGSSHVRDAARDSRATEAAYGVAGEAGWLREAQDAPRELPPHLSAQ